MHSTILKYLADIEEEKNVRVLFAVESGSRAWGFESPDSDWDVRFVYAHDYRDYLSLSMTNMANGTITRSHKQFDLDVVGWDLFKAMSLLRKSNPSIIEWLNSPIIYKSTNDRTGVPIIQTLKTLSEDRVSLKALAHHYISMTKANWQAYIADKDEVNLKKYLYAVRPSMCARFVMTFGAAPPTDFAELRRDMGLWIYHETLREIDKLVERKKEVRETDVGPRIPLLDAYIQHTLDLHHRADKLDTNTIPDADLNKLIHNILRI